MATECVDIGSCSELLLTVTAGEPSTGTVSGAEGDSSDWLSARSSSPVFSIKDAERELEEDDRAVGAGEEDDDVEEDDGAADDDDDD